MIKVNLVPAEILAKAQQKQRALQIGLAGGAVALLLVAASTGFVVRLQRLQVQLTEHEAEFQRLSAVVAKVKEAETAAGLLRARLKVIDDLDRGRRTFPYFMCDFTRNVPPGVRVRSMTTNGGNGSVLKLSLAAEARSSEDIALWVRKMEESGRFSGMELGPVSVTETAGGVLRGFTMTAAYAPQL